MIKLLINHVKYAQATSSSGIHSVHNHSLQYLHHQSTQYHHREYIINIACITMKSSYTFKLHHSYKYTTAYCTYSTHTPLFASQLYATVFFTTVYITVYTFDSTCIIIILIHNHYHHCTYFTICIYMFHLYFNSSGLYNFTENQFARRVSHRTRVVYLILIILYFCITKQYIIKENVSSVQALSSS